MGIKWDNIHVRVTGISNEIILVKGKEKVLSNGRACLIASDKSDDRTQEVLDAAIQYLLNLIERSESTQKKAVMERDGIYRLTLEDLREASA